MSESKLVIRKSVVNPMVDSPIEYSFEDLAKGILQGDWSKLASHTLRNRHLQTFVDDDDDDDTLFHRGQISRYGRGDDVPG